MAVIAPPTGLTLRALGRWRLDTKTPTAGGGLDGRQQFIRREARVWMNSYQVRGAWFGGEQEEYEAFLDQLNGPANTFNLPVPNRFLGSGYETLFVTQAGEFAVQGGTESMLVLTGDVTPEVLTSAPEGATQMTLSGADGDIMPIGSVFSVNSFLYRIATNSDGAITINPPLREAVSGGTVLDVEAPSIRVRLVSDAAAQSAHDFGQIGAPHVLSVVEAFDR